MSIFCSFLKLNNISLFVCIYHILLIQSSLDRYLGCFHVLAIRNNDAMNTSVPICLQDHAFKYFVYIARSGIARSYGNFSFNFFLETTILLSRATIAFFIFTTMHEGSNFPTSLFLSLSLFFGGMGVILMDVR